jgi:hypothetical protein
MLRRHCNNAQTPPIRTPAKANISTHEFAILRGNICCVIFLFPSPRPFLARLHPALEMQRASFFFKH